MEDYLRELHDRGAEDWVVQHAQAPEDAAHLVARGRAILGTEPLFCTQVGPVLGAHLGSGVLVGGITGDEGGSVTGTSIAAAGLGPTAAMMI
jgi:hypothetical protein